MSKNHAQKRAAKAARRKKLVAERRKADAAESQVSLATRVRRMAVAPMHSCLIGAALFEIGSGYLVLARKALDGRIAMAIFLLDTYCVGVKDVILRVDVASELESLIQGLDDVQPMVAIEPARARKLLRDLVAWSRSIGLAPHPDFTVAESLFGDVSVDACNESFSFGKDGKPMLMRGPGDTPARIRQRIEALRRTVGDDGFEYVLEVGMDDDADFFDDEGADTDEFLDAEIDDAVESVTGLRYDPHVAPVSASWLEIGEDERIMLAEAYHRQAEVEVPTLRGHAIMHVIIENQVAMGDELPVRRAIERLMGEGLDRHDAVHAVGSVLAAHLTDTLRVDAPNNEAYYAAVERLTAESWRAAFESIAEDQSP